MKFIISMYCTCFDYSSHSQTKDLLCGRGDFLTSYTKILLKAIQELNIITVFTVFPYMGTVYVLCTIKPWEKRRKKKEKKRVFTQFHWRPPLSIQCIDYIVSAYYDNKCIMRQYQKCKGRERESSLLWNQNKIWLNSTLVSYWGATDRVIAEMSMPSHI